MQFNVEEDLPVYGSTFTEEEILGLVERLGANTLIVFARDGWGRAFYRSRLYPPHPAGIRVEELDRLASGRGISLIVMADHTANRFLAQLRPDSVQRGPRGEPRFLDHVPVAAREEPQWPLICPNSPAFRDYMVPEAGEALDAAPGASALLLDSFRYMPDPGLACFCRWCRERFRRETGMELPERLEPGREAAYREAWRWRLRVAAEALERLSREARARGALVLFNTHPGGWASRGVRIAYEARRSLDGAFVELSETDARGPGFARFMVKLSRAALGGGKRALATRNAFPLLRVPSSAPPAVLEHDLWEIVAAGGEPVVTVFASTARLDRRWEEPVARVYRELEALEELLAEAQPWGHVALIYSPLSHDWGRHATPWAYVGELMGLAAALESLGIPWTIEAVDRLTAGELEQPVAAAAALEVASDAELEELLRHAERGAVIATGQAGRLRPDHAERWSSPILERLGAELTWAGEMGAPWLAVADEARALEPGLPGYVALGAPDHRFKTRRWDPVLGHAAAARPRGEARVLAWLHAPLRQRSTEYTAGRSSPPPGPRIGAAVLASRGLAAALFHLGLHYQVIGHPDYALLVSAMLKASGAPEPLARLEPWSQAVLEAKRLGEGMLLHLLPRCPPRLIAAYPGQTTPGAVPPATPERGQLLLAEPLCRSWETVLRLRLEQPHVARLWRRGAWEEKRLGQGEQLLRLRCRGPHLLVHLVPAA